MTAKFIGSGYPNEGSKYYTVPQADSLLSGKSDSGHSHGAYQASNSNLTAISGLTSAANKLPYFTGSGAADVTDITVLARTLLSNSSTGTMQSTLGLVIGTNVQSYSATLAGINTLGSGTGFLKNTAGTWSYDTSTYLTTSSASSTYLTQSSASSNYQAKDTDLTALSALSTTGIVARTGSATYTPRTISTLTSDLLTITNGDGVSGNPTISLNPDFFYAIQETPQNIDNGVTDYITFTSAAVDQSNSVLWTGSTDSILITDSGYYEISGCVAYASSSSGTYRSAGIYITNTGITESVTGGFTRVALSSGITQVVNTPTVITYISGGEYVKLAAQHNHTSTVPTAYNSGTGWASSIKIKRVK